MRLQEAGRECAPGDAGVVGSGGLRAPGDPLALTSMIREQVRALDKDAPVQFSTMTGEMDRGFSSQRFNSIILWALVTLRTQEIGVRIALGTRSSQVLSLIIGAALRLILAGVASGAGLAVGLTRFFATLLYGVSPTDALTFGLVAFLS